MTISMIAALTQNSVIGKNNDLPWHLPDDMKYFMQTTKGHVVIMGRKNYQSIPEKFRPLPNRTNIVITRQTNFEAPGCQIINSLDEAISVCKQSNQDEIFLIGGSSIYKEGLRFANKLYLTEIRTELNGDVYFPQLNMNDWKEKSRVTHSKDDRHQYAFDFVVYEKAR